MTGEYEQNGRRLPVNGDISKLERVIGATDTERALIRNVHFMSARIAGTRQIRGGIRHVVFATRAVYGVPIFMTLTPSERHSGLAIRLFRGRRKDPAFTCGAEEKAPGGKNSSTIVASYHSWVTTLPASSRCVKDSSLKR